MMCKFKGGMNKGGHYVVEMKGWIPNCGIIRCKLKGRMENGVHYEVEVNGWMEKVVL